MHQIARAGLVDPVLGIIEPIRVGHGVEVVQVAEEFVEAVHGGQELVQVAEVVLAELPGGVALRFSAVASVQALPAGRRRRRPGRRWSDRCARGFRR